MKVIGVPLAKAFLLFCGGASLAFSGKSRVVAAAVTVSEPDRRRQLGVSLDLVMLKDIAPGSSSSSPRYWVPLNNKLYFQADENAPPFNPAGRGRELWVTDGTEAGTNIVKDINPGGDDGVDSAGGQVRTLPYRMVALNGKLYFYANDGSGTYGRELWVSDGTESGTQLLKDIYPGSSSSDPRWLFTEYDGKLYFSARDGTYDWEPWVTDGSTTGTIMLKDIAAGGGRSLPGRFFAYGGKLYFNANDGTHGRELWVTDGTELGTELFMDINVFSSSSNPVDLGEYDEKFYFSAATTTYGYELWVTDGTVAGTEMLKDINPGSSHSRCWGGGVYNGKFYFSADDGIHGEELWATDGTTSGTQMVKDIYPGIGDGVEHPNQSYPYTRWIRGAAIFNGVYFFPANDGVHGTELWMTDGTEAGTQMLKDINPGSADGVAGPNGDRVFQITEYAGIIYFSADDGVHGEELWVSDGTESGTQLAADIYTGGVSSHPHNFFVFDGMLLFVARDSSHGYEIWKASPTSPTTSPTSLPTSPTTMPSTSPTIAPSTPAPAPVPAPPTPPGGCFSIAAQFIRNAIAQTLGFFGI